MHAEYLEVFCIWNWFFPPATYVPAWLADIRNFHRRRIKTSCRFLIKRIKSCVYSNKYELFSHDSGEAAPHSSSELASARQLRGAFSDTEEFIDHSLVSANRCSSRTSSISSWTENIKPSFTKKLKFQSVLEGEPVELKCKLIACPSPTILWFHNNRSIPRERRRKICTESLMHMHITSLVIETIREKDSGSYKVMAINTEGSAESTASLLVSLREEQSANYLGFARRSAQAHQRVDNLAEQRKERKFRVDLRCVGSPFDKMAKVHQGRSRSKGALLRTVYFRSGTPSKDKESEKESKHLETASERALSPPPMFDRSERFNDRFSDVYCDRRTGARFSDKLSDRCSDRYSDRFSDTESLHNEVRTKLTTLQKAVKQKKRLSISTMSSSEFELESVTSESSYAEYVERLKVKPACMSDEKRSSREPSCPRVRHLFEPQSRTRAIQIMKGELVDTVVPQDSRKPEAQQDQTMDEHQLDVGFKQGVGEHQKIEAGRTEAAHTDALFSESKDIRMFGKDGTSLLYEEVPPQASGTAGDELCEEEESLRAQYEKSLEAERQECEDKLLALRIRKWQQGSKMSEEMFHTESAEEQYAEPTGNIYTQQKVVETRLAEESETTSLQKPSIIGIRKLNPEYETPRSCNTQAGGEEVETSALIKPADGAKGSLRAHYEKNLEAERLECEEKLLALRIRKWQQGVQMSEEESFHPETDLPFPADTGHMEPGELVNPQPEAVERGQPVHQTVPPKSPNRKGKTETRKIAQIEEQEAIVPRELSQKSPRIRSRAKRVETQSPSTKVRAERKSREEQELQLSRENISELKSESETFVSEEEALTHRIMKWQQDVLMEQQQAVEQEPGWVAGCSPFRAETAPGLGRTVTEPPSLETSQQPVEVCCMGTSAGQSADEKYLLNSSVPAGFQDPEVNILQWPSTEEGRETRLQTHSEYFVSEEEAMAQRILKWQQDITEPEEVAELESEWALDTQAKQASTGFQSHLSLLEDRVHTGSSPSAGALPKVKPSLLQQVTECKQSPTIASSPPSDAASPPAAHVKGTSSHQAFQPLDDLGGEAERRWRREGYAPPVDKSGYQHFQTDVSAKRGTKEEEGAAGEMRYRNIFSGRKEDERNEESIRKQRGGAMGAGSSQQETSRMEDKIITSVESRRVMGGDTCSPGSPPRFLKEISSLKNKIGEMSEFTCQFHGDPLPTVTWLKDGQLITHNPDLDIKSKPNISRLTIFYPTTDHEGVYECVITNKHGTSICSATLEISDKKLLRGAGVTQEVFVTDEPGRSEESQDILEEEEIQTYMSTGKTMLQVPQTVIHKHRFSDESFTSSPVQIRVTAATPLPEMPEESSDDQPQSSPEKTSDVLSDDGTSQTFKHKFTFSFDVAGEAPCVVAEQKNVAFSEGCAAVLKCIMTGDPAPEVAWYFNDLLVDTMTGKYRTEADDKTFRLHISSFTHANAGVYKCVAKNKFGEVTSISHASLQVGDSVQTSDGGDSVLTPAGVMKSSKDFQKPDASHSEDKAPTDMTAKAPKFKAGVSTEPPALSGCGLQGSAAIIKVSQIKQAFESDSPDLISPPSPEGQRKQTHFPEEFIPPVAVSLNQQEEKVAFGLYNQCGYGSASTINPCSPEAPETVELYDIGKVEGQTGIHDAVRQSVEDVKPSMDLVKPTPQKRSYLHDQVETSEGEMVKEPKMPSFDRTSSFIPFKSEKVPVLTCSARTARDVSETKIISGSSECERAAAYGSVDTPTVLDGSGVAKILTEVETLMDEKVKGLDEMFALEGLSEENRIVGQKLISVPEASLDSGIFVGIPESQVDATEGQEKTVTGEMVQPNVHRLLKPEPLVIRPNVPMNSPDPPASCVRQQQEGDDSEGVDAVEAGGDSAAAAGSMEEEEVTFGAVYDYYNPPAEWGRPLTPESEMSIELGSTVSEEVVEATERFYTPGSSTEVSLPNAESLHTLKSSHTPSSEAPGGFLTPEDFLFSPIDHKRPSTGNSSEKFFSPVQFLNSPADEEFKINPTGMNLDENQFHPQARGSLGHATLQEKVQGIPPAFLKPLIKKRVFERESLSFAAEVFGLPSPDVRWFCNKTQLVEDDRIRIERDGDSISLVVHSVTKADQGEYICEAVNYVGEARSVALVVVVSQEARFMLAPPAVTHQHVMLFDVEENNNSSRSPSPQEILLEVELDENEVKEFEKQVKIITIPEYTADNKSMVISLDVLPSIYEEGTVDFVTQEHDDLKIAFEVTEMPPRFINPICDMETPEGTTVMFECSLMGIPSPIVSWFRGDKKVPHNTKKYLHFSDGDNHFLKISKVMPQDSGVYTCRAINPVGETLCRASLVVLNAKAFSGKTRGRELTAVSLGSAKVQPQKFDLMVGNTSFDGEQVSEIELEFEFEQEVDESQRAVRLVANTEQQTSEQGEKYVSINFDVFAEPAKDEKVEFKGKSSDTCSFHFQVTEMPPKCVIPLNNMTAAVGTPVILQCLFSGKPNPTASWYRDGDPITDSRCIIQEKSAGHFNLLITNVIQSDAGEYKCIIQNSAGRTETAALLKVF
ncbi:muscle M-line assembly protein unc-89-like [Nothobranchius furzeri]|uniref:muscle M-line assembly protein unc-89-like n=1 Tax=Nothobranchius furzeri TaxID=105023 RepID=UPI0039046A87